MGKQRRIKEARKQVREIEITLEELEGLLTRLENKALIDKDYPLLIDIIKNISVIEERFKNSTSTVKKLQKLLFGPKTERSQLPPELKAIGTGAPAQGHGRRPVDSWVDEPARICVHSHDALEEGQLCPK
jgi:hypothetical protein